jgi:hypothetical protein
MLYEAPDKRPTARPASLPASKQYKQEGGGGRWMQGTIEPHDSVPAQEATTEQAAKHHAHHDDNALGRLAPPTVKAATPLR